MEVQICVKHTEKRRIKLPQLQTLKTEEKINYDQIHHYIYLEGLSSRLIMEWDTWLTTTTQPASEWVSDQI